MGHSSLFHGLLRIASINFLSSDVEVSNDNDFPLEIADELAHPGAERLNETSPEVVPRGIGGGRTVHADQHERTKIQHEGAAFAVEIRRLFLGKVGISADALIGLK